MYQQQAAFIPQIQGQTCAQTSSPREATHIEAHLHALLDLHSQIGEAAARAQRLADHFLGCEPVNIAGRNEAPTPRPADPPIVTQLDEAIATARSLLSAIHSNLSRLERL